MSIFASGYLESTVEEQFIYFPGIWTWRVIRSSLLKEDPSWSNLTNVEPTMVSSGPEQGLVSVGDKEGMWEGETVGLVLGPKDGETVGNLEGLWVGFTLGPEDGETVGTLEGLWVGVVLGLKDGETDGTWEGFWVGVTLGLKDGDKDGKSEGFAVGARDGFVEGSVVGPFVGAFSNKFKEISSEENYPRPSLYVYMLGIETTWKNSNFTCT